MSSCQSYADPRDINDADFQPTDSQTDVQPESRVTVDKLPLFKCNSKLENTIPQLARANMGMETAARVVTSLCQDLFVDGFLPELYVFPKSKFESLLKSDGKRRIDALAQLKLRGK